MDADRFAIEAHALIIGVSAYVHVAQLPSAVRDGAKELAAILSSPEFGGYRRDQVHLLTDGQATRESILESLQALSAVDIDATVFLYFAGHGGRTSEGDEVYFLSAEADDASSERLSTTAISGRELGAGLAAISARRWVALFDCCHAGGLGGVRMPQGLPLPVSSEYYEALSGRDRAILASSRANERSWLRDAESSSIFTEHLLAALRGGVRPCGSWIRVLELFEHIQPKVTAERPDQHPVLRASLEENFAVAFYLGGVRNAADDEASQTLPYHAYLNYVDEEPDSTRVWKQLVPSLEQAGLEIAVSGDVEEPGVHRVVGVERGIEMSRRTVVILSDAYLGDQFAEFIDVLAQTRGIEDGIARLIPVHFGDFNPRRLPARLRMLVSLDLGHEHRGRRNLARLIRALRAPRREDSRRSL